VLPDQGEIPLAQVQPTQQLDQVLASFDSKTQHNLQLLLNGTGQALSGRGQDLNDAFGNFDPAVTELSAVVGVLNQQQASLQSLINNGATVLSTLQSRSADLQSLVTSGDQVLSTTAQRNAELTATVNGLPPFLAQLRTTLTTLNGTLGIARPSLAALRPVAPLLTPALRDLTTLSGPVVTLLHQAPSLLRAARVALPAIQKFANQFRPAVDVLLPAAQQIVPVINIVAEMKQELQAGMVNLAAILQGTAGTGTGTGPGGIHYIRAGITVGSDSVYGQATRSPGERNNTYFSPGELKDLASGLYSASCSNTGNSATVPVGTANVPCKLQPTFPWGHGIKTSYFPHVTAGQP
jgi:ABC-type transporter Mla subunit MlaD